MSDALIYDSRYWFLCPQCRWTGWTTGKPFDGFGLPTLSCGVSGHEPQVLSRHEAKELFRFFKEERKIEKELDDLRESFWRERVEEKAKRQLLRELWAKRRINEP